MTRKQFDDWLILEFGRYFPESYHWLRSCLRSADVVDAWFEALQHIDVTVLSRVTVSMFHGADEYPWPGDGWGKREQLPAHLRKLCGKALQRQEQREMRATQRPRPRWERQAAAQQDTFSCGEEYRKMLAELDAKKQAVI